MTRPTPSAAATTRGALLAVAGLAATLPAAAQSSVTIGGVLDLAARQVRNDGAGSIRSLVSGSNATSRLIFRGSEDLGGGLSAGFHLEHGIAADTGAPTSATQFWDRRSTLSLVGRAWGELRAGRDFVPTYVNWSRYDPFGYVGVGGANNFVNGSQGGPIRAAFGSGPNTTVRSSNALQYLLPAGLAGVEGGLMLAAGEGGTAANGQGKLIGGRLGYAAGPFGISAATATTENDLTTGGRFRDQALAGQYDFGVVKVSAAWRRFRQADATQTQVLLGAWVPIGNGELKLSWNRADLGGSVGGKRIDANGARQLAAGYVHHLSKRTALYATVARIDNDGSSTYAVPGGPAGLTAGDSSTGAEAGLRHQF